MKKKNDCAQWKKRTHLFRADEFVCTRCSASSAKPFRHCPNCHAAMRRGKSDLHWIDELEIFHAITD